MIRAVATTEAAQFALGAAFAGALLLTTGSGDPGTALLTAYWALSLPVLGYELSVAARRYPTLRNVAARLLEPLGAPEQEPPEPTMGSVSPSDGGVAVAFEDVTVTAAGHQILHDINLQITPGSHVAIIGPSGAGKSTLLGLLLGWHRPAHGRVIVDGAPLDLDRLRETTAWVDPVVQLWNRSLADNLCYGASPTGRPALPEVIRVAQLEAVLTALPHGLDTRLGEAGGLLSGGEGQRVRLGRALQRGSARLVLLDEPFRGLDRATRRELLLAARAHWPAATLLCITHDVAETATFDRVLVVKDATVVEDGPPAELAARPGSRYRALLDAQTAVQQALWGGNGWRRLRLEHGRVRER